jgi:hypothetical protein
MTYFLFKNSDNFIFRTPVVITPTTGSTTVMAYKIYFSAGVRSGALVIVADTGLVANACAV